MTTDEIHRSLLLNQTKLTHEDIARLLRALRAPLVLDLEQTSETPFIAAHISQAANLLCPNEDEEELEFGV